jgi:hypothetical protein
VHAARVNEVTHNPRRFAASSLRIVSCRPTTVCPRQDGLGCFPGGERIDASELIVVARARLDLRE